MKDLIFKTARDIAEIVRNLSESPTDICFDTLESLLCIELEEFSKNAGLEASTEKKKFIDFRKVPFGTYEVNITEMKLAKSNEGRPILSAKLKILSGAFANAYIDYNQDIDTGFGLHLSNEFLRSLGSGIVVEFETFTQYAELIRNVFDAMVNKDEPIQYYAYYKGLCCAGTPYQRQKQ